MAKRKLLHARFWRYKGNHYAGRDCERYDPHGFGLRLIAAMAYIAENDEKIPGVSLAGVLVRHRKRDSFGHEVHIAATQEQWDAVKKYLALV